MLKNILLSNGSKKACLTFLTELMMWLTDIKEIKTLYKECYKRYEIIIVSMPEENFSQ